LKDQTLSLKEIAHKLCWLGLDKITMKFLSSYSNPPSAKDLINYLKSETKSHNGVFGHDILYKGWDAYLIKKEEQSKPLTEEAIDKLALNYFQTTNLILKEGISNHLAWRIAFLKTCLQYNLKMCFSTIKLISSSENINYTISNYYSAQNKDEHSSSFIHINLSEKKVRNGFGKLD
jgi:hypothetical protein